MNDIDALAEVAQSADLSSVRQQLALFLSLNSLPGRSKESLGAVSQTIHPTVTSALETLAKLKIAKESTGKREIVCLRTLDIYLE